MMAPSPIACEHSGVGKPIVLLHPIGLDGTFWARVARGLEANFSVYRPDMPGHGRTTLGERPKTTADYAAEVARFIAERCAKAHAVVGLSFGGMIAQEVALNHGSCLERLVLCGCTATFTAKARPAIRERGALAEREGMGAVVQSTLERWFTPGFLASGKAEAVRHRLETDDPVAWAAAWSAISRHDAQSRLASLRIPTLCIAGERDLAAPVEAMRVMAEAIPGATFQVLSGAPHMMHIESPEALVAALLPFLRQAH
jgi:pimeloyl-ACP methyl ester carboxylesterase